MSQTVLKISAYVDTSTCKIKLLSSLLDSLLPLLDLNEGNAYYLPHIDTLDDTGFQNFRFETETTWFQLSILEQTLNIILSRKCIRHQTAPDLGLR